MSDSVIAELHPHATCWEILTLRLGRYAREFVERCGPSSLSDDMLQEHARRILYDSDDPWNQTAADNPEWLGLFKKAHGIDAHKPWSGTTKHHNILEDLGLRPDAALDKSFDLSNFDCITSTEQDAAAQALAFECALSGSTKISTEACKLTSGHSCVPGLYSSTTSPSSSTPATTYSQYQGIETSISELACTVPGGVCIGENGELGFAIRQGECSRSKTQHFLSEDSCSMAPIGMQTCTTAGEPILSATGGAQDHFSLPTWDQLPSGLDIQGTTAGMSTSVPASVGFDCNLGSLDVDMGVGSGNMAEGLSSAQTMRWDDSELGFNMDMDMDVDLDLDMNMDLMMASATNPRS